METKKFCMQLLLLVAPSFKILLALAISTSTLKPVSFCIFQFHSHLHHTWILISCSCICKYSIAITLKAKLINSGCYGNVHILHWLPWQTRAGEGLGTRLGKIAWYTLPTWSIVVAMVMYIGYHDKGYMYILQEILTSMAAMIQQLIVVHGSSLYS